jgi:AcrR family transcriptional regulator
MAARAIEHPTNARSRRTRDALLASTRSILEDEGFEALSMSAVAERARVSRGAAYLHFGSRADLVAALFEHIATTEGLTASIERVWAAATPVDALDEWARHLARYHSRLVAVSRAVDRVRGDDPDAAGHRARVVEAQLANCRRLATWLDEEGCLAPPWTVETATDMLWALISTDLISGLLVDRGWSQRRLAAHLGLLLRSTFAAQPSAGRDTALIRPSSSTADGRPTAGDPPSRT